MMRAALVVAGALMIARDGDAKPPAAPTLAVLAEAPGDDARKAIAIGPAGQVYAPDGKGAWTRSLAVTTADRVQLAGRASGVVVLAEGVVYRLADNGWSALRLAQKGKAVMAAGDHAVAIVGRQIYALDRTAKGEPAKLGLAPGAVTAIGAGDKSIVIATARGLLRMVAPSRAWKPIAKAPRTVERFVDDRWALVDRGPVDLDSGAITPWPAGFRVGAVTTSRDARGAVQLLAVGTTRQGVELLLLGPKNSKGAKAAAFTAELVSDVKQSVPVGIVADRAGRIVVAFKAGQLAIRERGAWTSATITEALPPERPGAAPALSR